MCRKSRGRYDVKYLLKRLSLSTLPMAWLHCESNTWSMFLRGKAEKGKRTRFDVVPWDDLLIWVLAKKGLSRGNKTEELHAIYPPW